jgi:hypothetical protein
MPSSIRSPFPGALAFRCGRQSPDYESARFVTRTLSRLRSRCSLPGASVLWTVHAGRRVNWFGCVMSRLGSRRLRRRVRTGNHCVIRRQGLRRWWCDLTDTAVRRGVRSGTRGGGLGCGLCGGRRGTRRGGLRGGGLGSRGRAGVRGHRPDTAHLQNLTRGIGSGEYSGAKEHSASGQCNNKQARGSGHDQLGGDNHRSPPFQRP